MQQDPDVVWPATRAPTPPILLCLLGSFRLLKDGRRVALRGKKSEAFLSSLALDHRGAVPREALLNAFWPTSEPILAGQALTSLVHYLRRLLADALGGAAPIVYVDGCYRLNRQAGVGVDVACFNALAQSGDREAAAGDPATAITSYRRAVSLYRGDLCVADDVHAVIERERLRALYLSLLGHLADAAYAEERWSDCLDYARRMLAHEPCREDAHRLVMRCHVRQGERAQALRQYRICQQVLRDEFDAVPEATTIALFDRVRLDPARL